VAFEGFQLSQVDVGEVSLRVRHGGSGPPLLLLHGYPETHMMWGKVADDLARDFTVIAPDLRGYGKSTAPADADDHSSYSKRAMGGDAVALMQHFGFEAFDLAGHDRGGRVAYRLALDHPAAVRRMTILDIIPTGEVWARADRRFALGYWHWSFLVQPQAEEIIGQNAELFFFRAQYRATVGAFGEDAYADYVESLRDPKVIHAVCEDYRAGARFDRVLDDEDKAAGRKIACPVQILWGGKGALAAWYDTLAIWREWASDVRGHAIDCGHFIPEEKPAETLVALRGFHGGG
jgi:haloacetate dehalogenase